MTIARAATVAVGLVVALVVTGCGAGRTQGATGTPAKLVTAASRTCPQHLLSLGSNPLVGATRAALRHERAQDGPQIVGAAVATSRFDRSSQVAHNCGRRVAARSVVVAIHRRAYDSGPNKSASLSQGTIVAGRFESGWRVWDILH